MDIERLRRLAEDFRDMDAQQVLDKDYRRSEGWQEERKRLVERACYAYGDIVHYSKTLHTTETFEGTGLRSNNISRLAGIVVDSLSSAGICLSLEREQRLHVVGNEHSSCKRYKLGRPISMDEAITHVSMLSLCRRCMSALRNKGIPSLVWRPAKLRHGMGVTGPFEPDSFG